MSISEEIRVTLRDLGLTTYETRAYLSLVEKGSMTASQISEYAEIPYSKIYESLNSLDKKGWVEIKGGRPKQYYPKSPSEALEAVKLKFMSRIKSWEQNIVSELQPIYERREIREKPDIWIIHGEFSIIAKLREMLNKVEYMVMFAIPVLSENLVKAITPLLTHLQSMEVSILLMVSKDGNEELEKLSDITETRMRDHMFGGGVITDDREVLLLLGGKENRSLALWSDHMGLIRFAKDYFHYLWDDSTRSTSMKTKKGITTQQ